MRLAPILLAVCGIGLAGGCLYLAREVLGTPHATASAAPTSASHVILIAADRDIAFGEPIRREDLVPQTWPADLAPTGAFDDATRLLGIDGTAPRKATQSIRAGDLVLASNVSEFGAIVTIGSTLTPGTRAVAIRVNPDTAVGGFISPGDHVDVVLTEGRGDSLRTGVILTRVRILAVDQNTETRGATMARTMTVEVSPRDSQRLVLAQEAGQLSLILRNDDLDVASGNITMRDVWGDVEPVAAPLPVEATPNTVRVRRGLDETEIVVEQ